MRDTGWITRARQWLAASLTRRLVLGLVVALVASLLALAVLASLLHGQALRREQERAAQRLAQVFEASLHSAMLQRDLPGLEHILQTLGRAPGVQQAALLTTEGAVRFASSRDALQRDPTEAVSSLCLAGGCPTPATARLQWQPGAQGQVLQVAYPIANQPQCVQCHGSAAQRPYNGVLLVDFQPQADASNADLPWLAGAGAASLALFALIMALTLRRQVAQPLARLHAATDRMAEGDWSSRAALRSSDELGQLSQRFDHMAARIAQTVQRLDAQQQFLQQLIDAIPDPLLVIGPHYEIRLANAAYARLVGQGVPALVGQPCYRASMGLTEPCPATLLHCPVAEMRRGAQPLRTVMSLRQADGNPAPVEVESAPLMLDGDLLTVEVMRPLERSVRFSQEQRLSTIGLLANGVAHEIHNPLASIRLALQASLRGLRADDISQAELVEYLELVDSQIDRCVHITQRLMQMSQAPGALPLPVDVRAACDDVLALLATECQLQGVQTHVDIAPERVQVLGDEAELRQVLVNLVHNALHAMPSGGQIRITARPDVAGRALLLEVADTGCGIAPEHLGRIFLPFFSRRADGQRGMGLGLAISKSIVERWGGAIGVSSQPGQGAVFHVHLPLAGGAPPESATDSGPPGNAKASAPPAA